jgi:hypothetical protein
MLDFNNTSSRYFKYSGTPESPKKTSYPIQSYYQGTQVKFKMKKGI